MTDQAVIYLIHFWFAYFGNPGGWEKSKQPLTRRQWYNFAGQPIPDCSQVSYILCGRLHAVKVSWLAFDLASALYPGVRIESYQLI